MVISIDMLTGIGQFVAALAALILIHEIGHFIAARLIGIEIEEFGIGYPPRITTLFRVKNMEVTLNWLPFGGFVRPRGENDPSIADGLAAANPWKRLFVLLSGPAMNFLAAVLLYAVIFVRMGMPLFDKVIVIEVAKNSPAEQVGLLEGDLILQIDDQIIDSTQRMQEEIRSHLGQSINLKYQRSEEVVTVSLVPRPNPPEGEGAIGIIMGNPVVQIPWYNALDRGVSSTVKHVGIILSIPFRLLQGNISPDQARLVGLKGMYDLYQNALEVDAAAETPYSVNLLSFLISITVSLTVINLLPFPALDGGRILLILPEIIFRRRIPHQFENMLHLIGFAVLITLLIYINLQDFINPVQIP
ncbi:MAG: M50 family metallopeptidase [Chloroflexota bacterium]